MSIFKYIFFTLFALATQIGFCCDNSSITLNSQTSNPDGSITYNLDLSTELGLLDYDYYGFTLSFNSTSSNATVIIGGPFNTTPSLSSANINSGNLIGSLQALTGSNINSVANDNSWNPYLNQTNVISYESNQFWGAASMTTLSYTIDVTVMGCVEQIIFNPSVNSLLYCGNFSVSLNSPSGPGTDTQVACNSYTWINGVTYNSSNNTATANISSSTGCDSSVVLNLTINPNQNTIDTQVACNSYTWINGITYTASNNTAQVILSTSQGCDSTINLDLTITPPLSGIDNVTTCSSYTWIDGNTYTSSNSSATHTIISANGCDSIVTLNLTISPPSTGIDNITACSSYTWIDGNTYNSSNSSATHTIASANGCDSVVTLNLTLNQSSYSTDSIFSCNDYTWIDGNTYTVNNNSATYTTLNSIGCDSIITLNLTIGTPTSSLNTFSECDSLTWINGTTYYSNNNSASYIITNSQGCDSIVNLDLTINSSHIVYEYDSICSNLLPYDWNGIVFNNSGVQTDILNTINNCDSTINYNLTIFDNPVVGINIGDTSICPDSSLFLFGTGANSYDWSNGITNNSFYSPEQTVNITITGTDTNNCFGTSSINITIDTCFFDPFEINIPNIFTPNNDSENDLFEISGNSFILKSINIINRWGESIYESNNTTYWNGRLNSGQKAPEGSYFYIIKFDAFYTFNTSTPEFRKGNLLLLR